MSASPADPPPADRGRALHQRLVDGDPTATDEFATAFLEPLVAWLTEHNPAIHPDLVTEAAEDAILAVIRNPASYRPQASSLEGYLRMSAQGDLRNLLRRETTHRGRNARLEIVEHSDEDGKYTGRDDDPAVGLMIEEELALLAKDVPASVRQGMTEVEARVLELMLRGEKSHAAYAIACGVTERPLEEQRRHVKRVKDRLNVRIKRRREA